MFFVWKFNFIVVKVDNYIELCFGKIEEQRVCRSSKYALALVQNVHILQSQEWHEQCLAIDDLKREAVLSQSPEMAKHLAY